MTTNITNYEIFMQCCRSAVNDDMYRLKKKHVEDHGGETSEYHVHHHYYSFSEIVRDYIDLYDIDISNVPFSTNIEIYKPNFRFYLNDDAESFREYHNDIAQLQVVTVSEHRQIHEKM